MTIKHYFKDHKYLRHSVALFIAMLLMIGFDSNNVRSFFVNLGKVLLYSVAAGFGLYILQMFSCWLLWPFIPKHEDFECEQDRNEYFGYEKERKDLLWLFIFSIITSVFAFSQSYAFR